MLFGHTCVGEGNGGGGTTGAGEPGGSVLMEGLGGNGKTFVPGDCCSNAGLMGLGGGMLGAPGRRGENGKMSGKGSLAGDGRPNKG